MGAHGTMPLAALPPSLLLDQATAVIPPIGPNAFHLSWESSLGPAVVSLVAAVLIERLLAAARTVRVLSDLLRTPGSRSVASIVVGIPICFWLQVDLLGSLLEAQPVTPQGMVLTGLFVASMTKLSERVFQPEHGDPRPATDRIV